MALYKIKCIFYYKNPVTFGQTQAHILELSLKCIVVKGLEPMTSTLYIKNVSNRLSIKNNICFSYLYILC